MSKFDQQNRDQNRDRQQTQNREQNRPMNDPSKQQGQNPSQKSPFAGKTDKPSTTREQSQKEQGSTREQIKKPGTNR